MIVVVDYGAANLLSITRALEAVGASVVVSDDPRALAAAEGVALPGVGAAGAAMQRMRASGMDVALRRFAGAGGPVLGVCLGMQLFFERLAEDETQGLGLLAGEVPLLPAGRKVPQIGWNDLTWTPDALHAPLCAGLSQGTYVYFVHSYYCVPADPAVTLATTDYGLPISAVVTSGSLLGMQFHPEKSGAAGLRLLGNWVRTLRQAASARHTTEAPA